MALRGKPQQAAENTDERRIEALIEKGGTVPTDNTDPAKTMLVQLRLPRKVIWLIDEKRKQRLVPPSRHSWMLEAILEKLKEQVEAQ